MRGIRRQFGFSLIEVLFAVLVLTMGLVFVASQFPIALSQSYDIAQTTTNPIFAQNAAIETELQIQNLYVNQPAFWGISGFIDNQTNFGAGPGPVFYLPCVNYRLYSNDMVMDNPTFLTPVYATLPIDTDKYIQNGAFGLEHVPNSVNFFIINSAPSEGRIGTGNLGFRVTPQVTYYDPTVIDNMYQAGFAIPFDVTLLPVWQRWNNEVFEAAQKRKFCQCVFYQCLDPSAAGGRNFRILIYTIKMLENQRYALQYVDNPPVAANYLAPVPFDAEQDRWLPVPFYVALQNPIRPYDRYFNIDANLNPLGMIDLTGDNTQFSGAGGSAYSQFPVNIALLLRKGSVIINAVSGELLEIEEVYDTGFKLRQNLPITDQNYQLQYFWVIPPPVKRTSSPPDYYGENQLVVDVSEKIIRF